MSSLEERREARRRRRMMEEQEETDENEAISTRDNDKGMTRARREKENRLSRLAAEVNSFNEEDDYERKRRERREAREARLRSAPVEEETTSRRSRRRADEDEEPPAEESRRSRRRRGGDDDEEAARQAAEDEKRRQEAEEQRKRDEADRERREAEEALQRIEDEKRAAEEAEKRKIEEEKHAAEEAERKKREAEERRKRINEDYSLPYEKKQTEFSVQSSHPYYNGNTMEEDDSANTDNDDDDDDEQPKSDSSIDTRSNPWLSDIKDIENEFRSCLSSSREDVYDSHTDDGSLEDSTDNDRYSTNDPIAHENNNFEDEHSVKKGETYNKRASTLPDSDKLSVVKIHASQFEVNSSIKEVQQQPNKKLDTPVKNLIPYRGSNLKDIQKKFETECNPPTSEPAKRNKNESNGKGFIGSAKISTQPVINGVFKKDSNSKVEKLKEVHIQFEMAGKTPTTGAHIKNITVHNAVSLPEKRLSLANGKTSSEENLNNCSKWPPERGRLVKDLSEKYLSSAGNDRTTPSQDKPLVGMKSVVKLWPCAHKAEISKTKVPETLSQHSPEQTSANRTEVKRDVLSRWPPPADPKQTARESISSAIAQKLNSTDLSSNSTTNLRSNPVSVTSPTATAAPISARWPPVSSTDKEAKHSTVSPENRKLKEKTIKVTSKQITPVKNNSLWSQPESISPPQTHALKTPTFHNSFDAINHLTKDAAVTGHHSLASTHSLNETEFTLNDFNEEEEREEAERKKRQEEPPHESLPVGEKSLQLNQVHHLGLNEVDEEVRKRQVLSERIIPLPENLEELSKAQMQDLVKKLHGKMAELEEEVYDWEFKLRRQEFEINDLTLKVNDTRGKFVKPVLRKISKTEAKLAKLERTKKDDFRTTLKSSGHKHDKIDEEDATGEAPAEEAAEAEA